MTYATGKYSRFICDRCSFAYDYSEGDLEPGTKYFVCPTCNDRQWNIKDHPQNWPPPVSPDPMALRNARTEPSQVSAVRVSVWLSLLMPASQHRFGFDGG